MGVVVSAVWCNRDGRLRGCLRGGSFGAVNETGMRLEKKSRKSESQFVHGKLTMKI